MLKNAVAGLLVMVSSFANAGLIVDTGPGPGSNSGGWSLYSNQWLAGVFTLEQQQSISSIEGWIGGGDGTVTLSIYDDGDSVPGSEIFSTNFAAGQLDDWYGATGLGLLLDAGTYWASFEIRVGDTFDGWMEDPVESPLSGYAFRNSQSIWNSGNDLNIGFRIQAAQGIPEPSTLAIFALSLIGLTSRRFKKQ